MAPIFSLFASYTLFMTLFPNSHINCRKITKHQNLRDPNSALPLEAGGGVGGWPRPPGLFGDNVDLAVPPLKAESKRVPRSDLGRCPGQASVPLPLPSTMGPPPGLPRASAVPPRRDGTFKSSGSHESSVKDRTLEKWTPRLLQGRQKALI